MGKGENAGKQLFPLVPPCFLFCKRNSLFWNNIILLSADASNLDKIKIKILLLGKELNMVNNKYILLTAKNIVREGGGGGENACY